MEDKEFWEWCGGKWEGRRELDGHPACYRMPDGKVIIEDIPITLDRLFRYAVPKLEELGLRFHIDYMRGTYLVRIWRERYTISSHYEDKDLAVAFRKATEKAIEGE